MPTVQMSLKASFRHMAFFCNLAHRYIGRGIEPDSILVLAKCDLPFIVCELSLTGKSYGMTRIVRTIGGTTVHLS